MGVKLQCLTEANPRETTFGSKNREFRKIEYSKNRDSTVFTFLLPFCWYPVTRCDFQLLKIMLSLDDRVFLLLNILSIDCIHNTPIFVVCLQCKDGYGGDGEECEVDPDLDGIPSIGLSCVLPNCFKVIT